MATKPPDIDRPANNQSLIVRVAKELKLSQADARLVVNSVLENMVWLCEHHPYLKLRDFGKFEYRPFIAREISDVHGRITEVPTREVLRFTSVSQLNRPVRGDS